MITSYILCKKLSKHHKTDAQMGKINIRAVYHESQSHVFGYKSDTKDKENAKTSNFKN